MHDYFEIVGVSPRADVREVRQAGRRSRSSHPDYSDCPPVEPLTGASGSEDPPPDVAPVDAAIDFVNMRTIVARMQAAFFGPHAAAR